MLTPLRAVAAHGLGPIDAIVERPLEDVMWRRLVGSVRQQRLLGLLARAVDDGALPVTEEQATEVEQREIEAAGAALRLERALLETVELLDAADVPARVLKGPAVAHLDYPDPAFRHFGDIDLLLPADHIDDALSILADVGCSRPVPELAPGFDRRFGKGATLIRPDGIELDIHRTFVAGTFGMRIDFDSLFLTGERFELGGRRPEALGRPERCLHACYHAALGAARPRLVPVRDVAEMLRHPELDWGETIDLAREWRGEAVVARAVLLCSGVLAADIDETIASWARDFEPTPRDRRAIEACLRDDGRFARQAMGAIRDVPGVRSKLEYLRALAFPGRAHLSGRGRSRVSHLARGGRRLRS